MQYTSAELLYTDKNRICMPNLFRRYPPMAFVEVSKQGHVGIVTMNRPETLNALSSAVFADLLKAFDVVENDEEIYVVVVTGAGRSFVAGADISEMATMNVVEGKNFGDLGNQAMLRLERMEKPTIAAINGFALGVNIRYPSCSKDICRK